MSDKLSDAKASLSAQPQDANRIKKSAEANLNKSDPSANFSVANSLVALFTGLLVVIGFLQVWTFLHSDRAYLSVGNFSLKHGQITAGVPVVVLYDVRNTGRQPARIEDARMMWSAELPVHPRRADYQSAPEPTSIERFIAGGDVFHGWMGSEGTPGSGPPLIMNPAQVNELINGTHYYFRGFVTYDDGYEIPILHPSRIFWFCALYDPNQIANSLFRDCEKGGYHYSN